MDCIKEKNSIDIEDTTAFTVASDLQNLLSTIKGRTILMKHSISPLNPLQTQFDEILNCIDESTEITNLLMVPRLN